MLPSSRVQGFVRGGGLDETDTCISHCHVKSVQSALSDLKRPPERLQSQCNYRSFITKKHLNGTLSETKLRPNLPKRNGHW